MKEVMAYRKIVCFFKNRVDYSWTISGIYMELINSRDKESIIKEHPFVRIEMEKSDRKKTYVWEWTNGEITHTPHKDDKPCAESPFILISNRKL